MKLRIYIVLGVLLIIFSFLCQLIWVGYSRFVAVAHLLILPLCLSLFLAIAILNLIHLTKIKSLFKQYRLKSLIPFVLSSLFIITSMVSCYGGLQIGKEIEKGRIPQYEELVKLIRSQIHDKPFFLSHKEIPKKYRYLCINIRGYKKENDISVVFLVGATFPNKHAGYLYRSNGTRPEKGTELYRDWHGMGRINEHWFRVSD